MKRDEQLLEEIRERIDLLCNNGVDMAAINALLSPVGSPSRLHITFDCRVCLTDYDNVEIKMAPLPKAVFLLYLRHEEGIPFKHLSEYKKELTHIYERIANRSSRKLINESIMAICSPTNNSINEKCARIRKAFLAYLDVQTAEKYCITGVRGDAKRIILPRDLVRWDVKF